MQINLVGGFQDGDFILSIDLCLNLLPDLRFVLEQNPEDGQTHCRVSTNTNGCDRTKQTPKNRCYTGSEVKVIVGETSTILCYKCSFRTDDCTHLGSLHRFV